MLLFGAFMVASSAVAYKAFDTQVLDAPHACPRPDSTNVNVIAHPSCYFAHNYFAARALFRANVDRLIGWERHALQVTDDDDLTIDIAVLRRNPKKLILHVSGTHGVEGFVGSAIQNAFLTLQKQAQDGDDDETDDADKPTIVLVHVLNPFGMANYRRWNEDNIDLNRNAFFTPEEWEDVLGRDPNIARYEDISAYINPPGRTTSTGCWTRLFSLFKYVKFDLSIVKRASVTGTYTNSKGIFYGGRSLAKSHQLLRDFLDKQGMLDAVEQLVLVDVHSGLGPQGIDTLLVKESSGFDLKSIFSDPATTKYGAGLPIIPAVGFGSLTGEANEKVDDVSKGYEHVVGGVGTAYPTLFRNVKENNVIAVTQEFGTIDGFFVLKSLIEENQAFHSDASFEEQLPMRQASRRAFDVDRHSFQRNVMARGLNLLYQSQQHLVRGKTKESFVYNL